MEPIGITGKMIHHWGVGVTRSGIPSYWEITGMGPETQYTMIAYPKGGPNRLQELKMSDIEGLQEAYMCHHVDFPADGVVKQQVSVILSPEIGDSDAFVKEWVREQLRHKGKDGKTKHPNKLACSREYSDYSRHTVVGRTEKKDSEILQFCREWVKENRFYRFTGANSCNCQNFAVDLCKFLTGMPGEMIESIVGPTDTKKYAVAGGAALVSVAAASTAGATALAGTALVSAATNSRKRRAEHLT